MEVVEIQKHIKIRSEALAEKKAKKLFKEWREEFLQKRAAGTVFTLKQILKQPNDSKLKLVYNAILDSDSAPDIHRIQVLVAKEVGKEVAFGTISARIGDLVRSELITEVGKITGRFGRTVATYGVINE